MSKRLKPPPGFSTWIECIIARGREIGCNCVTCVNARCRDAQYAMDELAELRNKADLLRLVSEALESSSSVRITRGDGGEFLVGSGDEDTDLRRKATAFDRMAADLDRTGEIVARRDCDGVAYDTADWNAPDAVCATLLEAVEKGASDGQ